MGSTLRNNRGASGALTSNEENSHDNEAVSRKRGSDGELLGARGTLTAKQEASKNKIAALFSPSMRSGAKPKGKNSSNSASSNSPRQPLGDAKVGGLGARGTTNQLLDTIPEEDAPPTMEPAEDPLASVENRMKTPVAPDIDSRYASDALACSNYAEMIFARYKRWETKLLVKASFMDSQVEITVKERKMIVDWISQTHHELKLRPQTLFFAVSYLDRYLEHTQAKQKTFQLVAATCLFAAAKFEEMNCPSMASIAKPMGCSPAKLNLMKQHMIKMERSLFSMLKGWLLQPTAHTFLLRYLRTVDYHLNWEYETYCMYLIESTLYESSFSCIRPSLVAAAAVVLTRRKACEPEEYPDSLWAHSGWRYEKVLPVVKMLEQMLEQLPEEAENTVLKKRYVYTKFDSKKYNRLASRGPRRIGENSEEFANQARKRSKVGSGEALRRI